MPKTSKRRRRGAETEEQQPLVSGVPETVESDPGEGDLGQAIDWVRRALTPFDDSTRKKIIKAAAVLMK